MQPPKIQPSRYEITVYKQSDISTQIMTRSDALAIRPESVDHYLAPAFGLWAHRTSSNKWIDHNIKWPRLGSVCIKVIQAVQLNPGEFLSPQEVSELTGIQGADLNNWLAARWLAIRKAHQESFRKPFFFLSRRSGGMAVAWNPQRSWMWIHRIMNSNPEKPTPQNHPTP